MTSFSFQERYRLDRQIGQGGMGAVWLATDTLLDRPVAIKYPLVTSTASQGQLLHEARLLAQLNHPHITTLYDFFIDQAKGRFYLVMEYVEGKSLSTIIKDGRRLPLEICLEVVQGVLRALSYAHSQGVVHRDIKPANVMIADEVKLTDFGLANLAGLLSQGTGMLAGTPAYLAPEQIEGRPTDGRADLYAVGVMLFEMITRGHLPFELTDEEALLAAHLHTPPPSLRQFVPDIPPTLEQLIMRLLAKDPAARYPSAEAVMAVLETIHLGPKLGNLPLPLTPFVGREAELAAIQDHLQDPTCRLLTLVGPGGSGKTRLALEAATAQIDHYAQGIFFVSLAPLDAVDSLVPTVAEALGFRFYEEGDPRQQLLDYLRQKNMLLILDNFEHLVEGADLVTEILEVAPEVSVVVTSRIRLNVRGEYLFHVGGMRFPERESHAEATRSAQEAAQYSAVQLFLSHVRQVQPDYEPSADDLAGIVRICRLVQGLPLGILLAAAWVEVLSPPEIAMEISHSLDFLDTDWRDLPERQRSLRAVFDHSWILLTEREREVFQGLSVFRGGFSRPAVQAVTGIALRELMALFHKSLLRRLPGRRYDVAHEVLRQFAAEKLEASGEANTIRDAHSAYYAEFLVQRRTAELTGHRQVGALDEIETDFENVRTAWKWSVQQKEYNAIDQTLKRLGSFCFMRRFYEGQELFKLAREHLAPDPGDEPHPVWGQVLAEDSFFRPHEVGRAQAEKSLAIAQKHGDQAEIAFCLSVLGFIARRADDYAGALTFYEQSLAHYNKLDDSFNVAGALSELAETYRLLGQPEEAIKLARQSLKLSREIGDKFWAAQSLANTGIIALYTGNFAEADSYLREANTINRVMGFRERIAESNVVLGKLAFLREDFEVAKALAEEALEIATDIGNKRVVRSARDLGSTVAAAVREETDEHSDEQKLVPITDIPPTIDRFQVKEALGVGSMGSVYLAYDPDSGRDVALKVANPEALSKIEWLSRMFNREAEIMTELAHPAIPKCYGYGQTADHYIVLELINGNTLEDVLEEQKGFLPAEVVVEWAIQICDALTYLHSQRPELLILRDLKPNNVLVEHNGQIRLVDFGIVEPYRPGQELPLIGTEGYSPPEQYIGYSDARSDIYALGVTLHQLLTRRDPRQEKPFSHHDAPPRSLNPAISEDLEAVILKAVEYKAEDRYQSAAEMKAALLACL